jgi:hypothetical protein
VGGVSSSRGNGATAANITRGFLYPRLSGDNHCCMHLQRAGWSLEVVVLHSDSYMAPFSSKNPHLFFPVLWPHGKQTLVHGIYLLRRYSSRSNSVQAIPVLLPTSPQRRSLSCRASLFVCFKIPLCIRRSSTRRRTLFLSNQ